MDKSHSLKLLSNIPANEMNGMIQNAVLTEDYDFLKFLLQLNSTLAGIIAINLFDLPITSMKLNFIYLDLSYIPWYNNGNNIIEKCNWLAKYGVKFGMQFLTKSIPTYSIELWEIIYENSYRSHSIIPIDLSYLPRKQINWLLQRFPYLNKSNLSCAYFIKN